MRVNIFHCDHCDHLVFFENTQCVNCGHLLAFLPDVAQMGSLEPVEAGCGVRLLPSTMTDLSPVRELRGATRLQLGGRRLRSASPLLSCRLTRVIPDLAVPEHRDAWYRLEAAKRRLVYTLLSLKLPLVEQAGRSRVRPGVRFPGRCAEPGTAARPDRPRGRRHHRQHRRGRRRRARTPADQLHEPYRTLLGHFRHESGHYYWDRLIRDSDRLDGFPRVVRRRAAGLCAGAPAALRDRPDGRLVGAFVSAYAGAHPWEDWAETWAHYLHMTDTLETAAACGLSIRPRRADEPLLRQAQGRAVRRPLLQPADRQLVSADLRPQQPQSRPRAARRVSVRPVAGRDRQLRFIHETVAALSSASSSPSRFVEAATA